VPGPQNVLEHNRFAKSEGEIGRMRTTTARESLWLSDPDPDGYALVSMSRVFGGSITGLITALLLKWAGHRVAVVEPTGSAAAPAETTRPR
jgi:hypothetical protein